MRTQKSSSTFIIGVSWGISTAKTCRKSLRIAIWLRRRNDESPALNLWTEAIVSRIIVGCLVKRRNELKAKISWVWRIGQYEEKTKVRRGIMKVNIGYHQEKGGINQASWVKINRTWKQSVKTWKRD